MDLKEITASMRLEIQGSRNQRLFDEAKQRHTVLAHQPDVDSVLEVLADDSPEGYWEREAITQALIGEHQRRPHRLWSTLLTIAYYPMLCMLRVRTMSDALSAEELDHLVVFCFLEVLERIPMHPKRAKTSVRLRSKTRRRVFAALRREQGRQDDLFFRDTEGLLNLEQEQFQLGIPEEMAVNQGSLWPEPRPPEQPPKNEKDQAEMVRFLFELLGDDVNPEDVEVLISTLVRGETLGNFSRLFSHGVTPVERRRIYERIKRRHSRALARLRALLASENVPVLDPEAFASIGAQNSPGGSEAAGA